MICFMYFVLKLPLSSSSMIHAVQHGGEEVIRWLYKHKCPFEMEQLEPYITELEFHYIVSE